MKKRLRDLYSFPKPSVNHKSMAILARMRNLQKYRDTIESLGGDGIQFFSDVRGNKGFWFFSENCPMVFEHGQYSYTTVPVYRKLQLPQELEIALEKRCVEFS
jgi:hypothetical protein